MGAIFLILYMTIFGQLTSIEIFIQERGLFLHEKTSGFYRTSAYFLAKVICEIIPTRVLPTAIFCVLTTYMIDLRSDWLSVIMYWIILTVTNLASTSLCMFVSSFVPVYSVGFLIAAILNVFFMVSSGFLLNTDQIPIFLLPFKYGSIFRYSLEGLLYLELHNRRFNCNLAEHILSDPTICVSSGDYYLQAKGIDFTSMSDLVPHIIALTVMTPFYLILAYICLRNLKKTV